MCCRGLNKATAGRVPNYSEGFKETRTIQEVPAWKRKKLIAMRGGDLRDQVIQRKINRKQDLRERFGDRLVLKQDYGDKISRATDRIVKHARKSQLDPNTDDKWGHDRYSGPKIDKRISSESESESEDDNDYKRERSNQNKVHVRNLPEGITKEQIKEIFSRYGKVKSVQAEDGFAFVSYIDNESALKAHYRTTHKKLLKIQGNIIKVTLIEDD